MYENIIIKAQKSKFYYYFVSFISQKLIVLVALLCFFAVRNSFQLLKSGILVVILAYATSEAIKVIVKRPRPKNPFLGQLEDTSFPSSHTTVAFAVAFSYMYWGDNSTFLLIFFVLAFFVALGRVLSGAHYVSDVIAGVILAFIVASIGYYFNLGIFIG